MNAADVARTINLIIAPVVLVTACGILQSGILTRYGSLGQRMRSLAHERLELIRSGKGSDIFLVERIQEIDNQLPVLIKRHRILQQASLMTYCAIGIFIVSMFAIALAVASNASIMATAALSLFIVGTGFVLFGVCLTSLEIRLSHQAICYEIHRVTALEILS